MPKIYNKDVLWDLFTILYIEKKLISKEIQREEFNVKESQRFNVSVQMNYHQD